MEEIWKDIIDFEGLYQVSNLGNVKRLSRTIQNGTAFQLLEEKFKKKSVNKDGYYHVGLYKNEKISTRTIHRLVAEAFLGKSNLQINHKNKNRQDNRLDNLEYVSCRDNAMHIYIGKEDHLTGAYRDKRCKNKWFSEVIVNKERYYLGRFDSQLEAHNAYLNACEKYNIENKYINAGKS